MNRDEAKFILRAYRVSGEDAHDPQFQEALDLAKQDPELACWLADERALDLAIAAKIRTAPIPPDLKTQLLLARKTIERPSPRFKPMWLAAAASIALLLTIAGWLLVRTPARTGFAQFRRAMTLASLDMTSHYDVMGMDAGQLKNLIIEHRGDTDYVLPAGLADKQIAGCKVLDWRGHRVTLLCFKFDGRHEDVFVVNESDLPGLSLSAIPELTLVDGLNTAAWRRAGKIYFVAGNMTKPELQQLF